MRTLRFQDIPVVDKNVSNTLNDKLNGFIFLQSKHP